MKRGLEEMSAEMSGPKKTKTVGNGEGSAEPSQQWTRVEKKKKKIRKAESKMHVCITFLPVSNYLLLIPFIHRMRTHASCILISRLSSGTMRLPST
jgi:hypothetical protein